VKSVRNHLGAKKYFPTSQITTTRWLDEIIAYFDNRTTSGVVEGINNKLKLIKRLNKNKETTVIFISLI
jgi:transposase